jgi:hypothetical protein
MLHVDIFLCCCATFLTGYVSLHRVPENARLRNLMDQVVERAVNSNEWHDRNIGQSTVDLHMLRCRSCINQFLVDWENHKINQFDETCISSAMRWHHPLTRDLRWEITGAGQKSL